MAPELHLTYLEPGVNEEIFDALQDIRERLRKLEQTLSTSEQVNSKLGAVSDTFSDAASTLRLRIRETRNAKKSLYDGFIWEQSKEGTAYWSKVVTNLEDIATNAEERLEKLKAKRRKT